MPFPLAHPAAVLPLRRWCPRFFSFPALIIGSLIPDVANCFNFDNFAHSLGGSLAFCLPLGFVALVVFYRVQKPLVLSLPTPHREHLLPLCDAARPSLLICLASLLVAIWGHLGWDLFTHDHSSLAEKLNSVGPVFSLGGRTVAASRLLWIVSSLGGACMLAIAYRSSLKATSRSSSIPVEDNSKAFGTWACLVLLPALAALAVTYVVYVMPTHRSIQSHVREIAEIYFPMLYFTLWGAGLHMGRRAASQTVAGRKG